MKKILSILLASALLVVCLASCGTHAAAAALDEMLATVKNGDFENASILTENPFSQESAEVIESMYKNFDYKIGSVTEKDGFADVEVSITITDIGKIFSDYLAKAMSGDDVSEDTFYEMLAADDAPIKTFDITVNMFEMSSQWVVSEGNTELSDALTGGLLSTLGGLEG